MAMATLSPSASMDEIKWVFDMCGFVLFPSLLSEEDVAAMVAEVERTLAYRQAAGGGLPDGLHMAPGVQRRIPATHEQVNHASRGHKPRAIRGGDAAHENGRRARRGRRTVGEASSAHGRPLCVIGAYQRAERIFARWNFWLHENTACN